jgi:hypothetical protein
VKEVTGVARTLKLTSPPMHGRDVALLQETINRELHTWHVDQRVDVDSEYGHATRDALRSVLHGLGIATSAIDQGVTPALRIRLRAKKLTRDELARYHQRAGWRRRLARRYAHASSGPAAAIAYARKWVGTSERPANSNRGAQIDIWQRLCQILAQPWCGCFANACLMAAGFPAQPWLRYCPTIEAKARAGEDGWTWHTISQARPGDLVLYGAGIAVHVGLYIGAGVTIEGNTSSGNAGSQDNGGMVAIRRRNFQAPGFPARGVARPPYAHAVKPRATPLDKLLQPARALLRGVDPKLLGTAATSALAWVALKLGLNVDDPNVVAVIALAAGGLVGVIVPNAASGLSDRWDRTQTPEQTSEPSDIPSPPTRGEIQAADKDPLAGIDITTLE